MCVCVCYKKTCIHVRRILRMYKYKSSAGVIKLVNIHNQFQEKFKYEKYYYSVKETTGDIVFRGLN